MDSLILSFFLVFGLIIGSFINVVGLRVPVKQSFTYDRSRCPTCKKILSWHELIPVLSFVYQKGKCISCEGKISIIYPFIELTTCLLYIQSYVIFGISLEMVIAILLNSMLMIIFVSDLKYMIIPNKVLLSFLPPFILLRMIEPLTSWLSSVIGSLVGLFLIGFIILVSGGGMGAGDMKLFGVIGIVLGTKKILLTFFIACALGTIIGSLLFLFKKIKRKQPIPFGPYIVVATIISYFYGDDLLNWYFNFFP